MKITRKQEGSSMTVTLSGCLDTETAPKLGEAMKDVAGQLTELTFDFADVGYVSSAGLREMLKIKRNMKFGGTVKAVNANEIVREVFRVTDFDKVVELV